MATHPIKPASAPPARDHAFDVTHALALAERSTPARMLYASLMTLISLATLPWQIAGVWLGVVAVWEWVVGPYFDRLSGARPTQAAGERAFAAIAFCGSSIFSVLAFMVLSAGTPVGAILGASVLAGSLAHAFVYYGGSRVVLSATLAPMLIAALAGAVNCFGPTIETLAAIASIAIMLTSASLFLLDKNAMVRDLVAKTSALEIADGANTAKSRFISTMSHELRTPLNAIIGYSELTLEEIEAGREPEAGDIEKVLAASRHLLSMIGDILDFSRIDAGDANLRLTAVPIESFVQDMTELMAPHAAANGNTLSVAVDADVDVVRADAQRLKQCLNIVLANAIKYTRDGRIEVRVRRAANGMAALTITDTGIGIAARDQHLLFEPFVQIDGATTRAYDGVGLGLAITRRLIRQMGGDVEMASEPGLGSTFSLLLPCYVEGNDNWREERIAAA